MRSQTQSLAVAAAAFAALTEGTPMKSFNDASLDMHLAKRTVTDITCGLWPSADLTDNGKNYNNLGDKGDDVITIEGKGCGRIGESITRRTLDGCLMRVSKDWSVERGLTISSGGASKPRVPTNPSSSLEDEAILLRRSAPKYSR